MRCRSLRVLTHDSRPAVLLCGLDELSCHRGAVGRRVGTIATQAYKSRVPGTHPRALLAFLKERTDSDGNGGLMSRTRPVGG